VTEEQVERRDEDVPADEDADPRAEYAEPHQFGSMAREEEPPDGPG
jgi:hypothetical protein